jgi:small-conductance mechanosensitive channel
MLSRVGLDEAQQFSLINLVRYTVMVLVLLVGLPIIGIDLSALTVIFGVLGIGLGFGLQSVVANFFSGLIIIITRPVKEGDRILVNGLEGDIIQIRMISTVINTLTNESIIIPNSKLVSESVHNYSFNDASIVIRNDIGVSYASDVDRVLEVLAEVAYRNPFRVAGKDPIIRFKEFGDSSLNFAVFTWIGSTEDKYAAHHWTNLEIWRALKSEGIEIPFPQRDVHLRSGWSPENGGPAGSGTAGGSSGAPAGTPE